MPLSGAVKKALAENVTLTQLKLNPNELLETCRYAAEQHVAKKEFSQANVKYRYGLYWGKDAEQSNYGDFKKKYDEFNDVLYEKFDAGCENLLQHADGKYNSDFSLFDENSKYFVKKEFSDCEPFCNKTIIEKFARTIGKFDKFNNNKNYLGVYLTEMMRYCPRDLFANHNKIEFDLRKVPFKLDGLCYGVDFPVNLTVVGNVGDLLAGYAKTSDIKIHVTGSAGSYVAEGVKHKSLMSRPEITIGRDAKSIGRHYSSCKITVAGHVEFIRGRSGKMSNDTYSDITMDSVGEIGNGCARLTIREHMPLRQRLFRPKGWNGAVKYRDKWLSYVTADDVIDLMLIGGLAEAGIGVVPLLGGVVVNNPQLSTFGGLLAVIGLTKAGISWISR
jgi:hypothetical protein